jgi:hypothetical protein
MSKMFYRASSFDQDISAWCVAQITQKPSNFDQEAGFEGVNAKNQIGGTLLKQALSTPCPADPACNSLRTSDAVV